MSKKTEVALSQDSVDRETGEIMTTTTSLPADFMDEVGGLSDLGYSTKSEDSMIPILAILQDNSAEVKKKHSKYIEGAEPGDLIIRSLGRVFKMGDNLPPIVLQPCGFDHVWVEWQGEAGEGTPVAQYAFEARPEDAQEVPDPQNAERTIWRMPNGNRLVDTRHHYCNLIDDDGGAMAIVVPMGGTNHTTSRSWTAQMKQHRIPGTAKPAPSFFRQYGLGTKFRQRGEQSWYTFTITDLGFLADEGILRQGLALLKAIQANTMVMETAATEGSAEGDDPLK